MKRIVVFYKNGDRYLKEMGSGKSSLYFFLFLFVLHSMREPYYSVHRILAVIYIRPYTCPQSYAWRWTY